MLEQFIVTKRKTQYLIKVLDNKTGREGWWLRGFTYKAWTCAATGELIPAGPTSWCWRMAHPHNWPHEHNLRVIARVFDA